MVPAASVLRVRSQHWGAETAINISNCLAGAALMLVAVVWPADRDAQPATKACDPLDMVERLRAIHAEPIHHVELVEVVYPSTQRCRKWVPIAEVNTNDPTGPGPDVRVRVE